MGGSRQVWAPRCLGGRAGTTVAVEVRISYTPTRSAHTARRTPPRGTGQSSLGVGRFFFCFVFFFSAFFFSVSLYFMIQKM
jgi:hypothetical protein